VAMGRLFGTNGIRGIPGKDLTDELVSRVGHVVAARLGRHIGLGHDGRLTSPRLSDIMVRSLLEAGSDVHLIGLAPTPAIQLSIRRGGYDGGVVITASHNPPEFNGIKVMGVGGLEITRSMEEEMERLILSRVPLPSTSIRGTLHPVTDSIEAYVKTVVGNVDGDRIRRRRFKVVVDAGNGVQALSAPKILERLGCHVTPVFCDVDGAFPGRGSEPSAEKLTALAENVVKVQADLGVAFDGDGDRVMFCDERGEIHTGDRAGALLLDFILSQKKGLKVVTTVATSSLVDHVTKKNSGVLFRIRVGSVDVTQKMVAEGAIAGLEENGGFFYAPHQPVRDGGMTAALMLDALARWERPLSEAMATLPTYHQRKGKLSCPDDLKETVVREVKALADGHVDTTDGVRIEYDDGSWAIVRPSGTEPLMRVFSESQDVATADRLYVRYYSIVESIIKKAQKMTNLV